jgi:hypothetical protein
MGSTVEGERNVGFGGSSAGEGGSMSTNSLFPMIFLLPNGSSSSLLSLPPAEDLPPIQDPKDIALPRFFFGLFVDFLLLPPAATDIEDLRPSSSDELELEDEPEESERTPRA